MPPTHPPAMWKKFELFAKKKCQSFEAAIDEAVNALRRQINKHKGKLLEKS